MFSIRENQSKYPKVPGEVLITNGERSGVFHEHILPTENLRDMPMKDTDVLLVTYPRSGTTMTQVMIVCLMEGTTKNVSENKLDGLIKAFPYLELKIPGLVNGIDAVTSKINDPYRLIKTHLPRWLAPKSNPGKRVFVTRDVKDTLISYFHFYQNHQQFGNARNVDFETFYEMFVSGQACYTDWFQYHRDWLDLKGDNEIWIRYEDLVSSFDETVKKLATFLKVELTDALLEDIRNLIKFDTMRDTFKTPLVKDFVRKGVVGDHVNYLTEEQIKYLDAKTKELVPELYGRM